MKSSLDCWPFGDLTKSALAAYQFIWTHLYLEGAVDCESFAGFLDDRIGGSLSETSKLMAEKVAP